MSYKRSPDALHAEVNGSLILMNVESLAYFEFNDVAKRIWEFLSDEIRSQEQIITVLIDEYDVKPEHCKSAVATFLKQALEKGFVVEA
ncbi:MAG: PqqD family protein [Chlorobium sp.]|jgi:Coenzyme PQQ synthesis protein D (PqqD)|nr:MAG: PqqD family protein [Chlorobium sp.]